MAETIDFGAKEAGAFLRGAGFGLCRVTVLEGGLWNRLFRVEGAGRFLTLKHYAVLPDGMLFPNLPEAEARALRRLAGLGVAPDLVGFWTGARVLIYTHVEGAHWSGDPAPVARLLRQVSAVDGAGFRLLPVTPPAILAEGDALFDRCVPDDLTKAWRDRRPVAVAMDVGVRSLVHTDVGAGNLIGAGEGLRLIDWQCPGAGDAAEDICSFLSPAVQAVNHRPPLRPDQRARFFDGLAQPDLVARAMVMEPFFAYRHAAYCCLRRQMAPELRDLYTAAAIAALPAAADRYP